MLDAGVKRLSELNLGLAALLLLFVILAGPTLDILRRFVLNIGAYATYLPELSNPFGRTDDNFRHGWTAFYWAWWISWSPFVGMLNMWRHDSPVCFDIFDAYSCF